MGQRARRSPGAAVHVLAALLVALLVVGCAGEDGTTGRGGRPAEPPALRAGTCWSATALGADKAQIADIARDAGVDGASAEAVLRQRPAFATRVDCSRAHSYEVYRMVRLPGVEPRLTSYADLVRTDQEPYRTVARRVQIECMDRRLARAAARTRLPRVLMEPTLPTGMHLEWAPPSPAQFAAGERGFACLFSQAEPARHRYSAIFTAAFPVHLRTCIRSRDLEYVGCARRHDRERIAVMQVRQAVLAGRFPGRKAIRSGPLGRYLKASAAQYAALDRACTTYLRSVSDTDRLTGIAEIDLDFWPAADGSYPIVCEAAARPNLPRLTTTGSVYDR